MIKNYFKTTSRNLWKNKTYSFINIIGLAIGTVCCLYILMYVQEQYSYDKHHKDADNIYRVNTYLSISGVNHNNASSSPAIAPALKNDFAEVQQYTRVVNASFLGAEQHMLRYEEKSFYETDVVYVDSTFFDVLSYHFDSGTALNALNEPFSVVLTKPIANKLFGNENAIGKVIEVDNAFGKNSFQVTGVVDGSAGNTHLQANLFFNFNSDDFGKFVLQDNSWAGNNFAYEYIKLEPNAKSGELEAKLPAFLDKYGADALREMGMKKALHLQPIASIHTNADYDHEISKTISPSFLYILVLIAVLIQVIACINFMNLATARASQRAKEVGVRKVVGAGKADLVRQFLGESFFLSLLGVLIALPLLLLALPYLNQVTEANINLSLFSNYKLWLILLVMVACTGLVAGSYPAFYLSAFQAVKVIKGNFTNQVSASGIRKSLVVFQFVLSIVLITGIIVIYSQLHYINNKDLGFNKEQRLVFGFYTDDSKAKLPDFANDLRQLAEVESVSASNFYLSQFVSQDHGVFPEGGAMETSIDAQNISTEEHFVKTNGIQIISGRDFRLSDSGRVLINETLMKRLGFTPENAIGQRLYTQYKPNPLTFVEVAGVMKDFNYTSLHNQVNPLMLVYNPSRAQSKLTVAVSSDNYNSLLSKVEALWHKDLPGTPFSFSFLNEEVKKQYDTEVTLSRIINTFTMIAILISCLGIFGLVAFSAEQRRKEIGIRKVLGASISGVVRLLSMDFVKLVFIAVVVASPIAWWAMSRWLADFAYRIEIQWWMFAGAGLAALVIALLTVSFQAIKAAVANPVDSLRDE